MRIASIFSIVATLYVVIGLLLGTVTFIDARKRKMNAGIWALIAFVGPFMIGFIVYLICRKDIYGMTCPKCGTEVEEYIDKCPNCGTSFVTKCPNCGMPSQRGWKNCPSCGSAYGDNYEQPIRSYVPQKSLKGPLVVVFSFVIALVVILLIPTIGIVSFNNHSSGYSITGIYNISREDMAGNPEITKWIEECDNTEGQKLFSLISSKSDICIVYVKNENNLMNAYLEMDENNADCTVSISRTTYENLYGYNFFIFKKSLGKDVRMAGNLHDDSDDDYYDHDEKIKVKYIESDISKSTWEE